MTTIQSMTGFAAANLDLGHAVLSMEIKSVNSRFLDIAFRLGDDLRALEMPLRERITGRIGRGKVECRGYVQSQSSSGTERVPNAEQIATLGRLDTLVRAAMPGAVPLSVAEVLRWPGVMADDEIPADEIQAAALGMFADLMDEFVASRAREGQKLADVLRECTRKMREQVTAAGPLVPLAIAAYLNSLGAALDVDNNGRVDGLTDGLLVLRYMLGLRGQSLIVGATGSGANPGTASAVELAIQALMP